MPCDVHSVVRRKCQGCHGDPTFFGAPVPLLTRDQLVAMSPAIQTNIHGGSTPMPPLPNALTPSDLQVLDQWLSSGMPPGSACQACPIEKPDPVLAPIAGDCTGLSADLHLQAAAPFSIPAVADLYTCYAIQVHVPAKRQITAILPRLDNLRHVHHIALFADTATSFTATAQPSACGGQKLLSVWVPGGNGLSLPPEAGFPLEDGTSMLVEVHYKNPDGATGQVDSSGFDLCTTDMLRPNDADIVAFGSYDLDIPAHSRSHLECKYSLPASLDGVHVVDMLLHMHLLGVDMKASLTPAGADPIALLAEQPFPTDGQLWAPLDQTLHTGDVVDVAGTWLNTTNQDVRWGRNVTDEMFYAYAITYPRVTTGSWSWDTPAHDSMCTATLE